MLISDDYIEQNRFLHEDRKSFGSKGDQWLDLILPLIKQYQVTTLLDYGAGKGSLKTALATAASHVWVHNYDPVTFPTRVIGPFDMVVCTDVMEHVEPDCLNAVLDDIMENTRKVAFFVIACYPAVRTLPDGRNAHLIVQPPSYWKSLFFRPDRDVISIPSCRQENPEQPDWIFKVVKEAAYGKESD